MDIKINVNMFANVKHQGEAEAYCIALNETDFIHMAEKKLRENLNNELVNCYMHEISVTLK
jgi:hypothetical protein